MSFEFHINGNQTTFFILFVLRSCTFGFADYSFKAKGNRTIELNHRLRKYRQKAKELLCSEEGLKHRGQRCIEPEAVFGQMKNNMNYKRFRHFGKDKVFMDFAFFAIAFNIKKMCAKITKEGMDWLIRPFYELTVVLFRCCERINQRNPQNIAA